MSFFFCHFAIANIFFFKSIAWIGTFFHGFRIPFPFPDSGFHVLVLPRSPSFATVIPVQGNFQSKFYEKMNI